MRDFLRETCGLVKGTLRAAKGIRPANPFKPRLRSVVFRHVALHGTYVVQKHGPITEEDMVQHVLSLAIENRTVPLDLHGFRIIEVW